MAESKDQFGITETFSAHLELALQNMHPVQAVEAAAHAARQYVASYSFVNMAERGAVPEYRIVAKTPEGRPASGSRRAER